MVVQTHFSFIRVLHCDDHEEGLCRCSLKVHAKNESDSH